jgi:hypothetical protein
MVGSPKLVGELLAREKPRKHPRNRVICAVQSAVLNSCIDNETKAVILPESSREILAAFPSDAVRTELGVMWLGAQLLEHQAERKETRQKAHDIGEVVAHLSAAIESDDTMEMPGAVANFR